MQLRKKPIVRGLKQDGGRDMTAKEKALMVVIKDLHRVITLMQKSISISKGGVVIRLDLAERAWKESHGIIQAHREILY